VIESNDETPPEITIAGSGSVSVGGERPPAPRGFALASPYPNPFNGTARFQFSLDRAGDAAITLHDLAGRRVADIANGWFEAGINAGVIRASDLPAGVYLLKLDSDNRTALQKIVLVK